MLVRRTVDKMFCAESTVCKERVAMWGSLRFGIGSSDPGVQPFAGIPSRISGVLKTANPVVADRVRERSCVCSSLSDPVLCWAGFLIETLEA